MASTCATCATCAHPLSTDVARCDQCGALVGPAVRVTGSGSVDVLAAHAPAPRRRGKAVLIGAAAVLAAAVTGGAVYAASVLGGGGTQPEQVLPATAIGFVKVDLDPAAGQKVAAYRLAQKFPDSGVSSEDGLKDDLVRRLLDEPDEAEYDTDVRPWLGDRAGIAFLPPTSEQPDEPVVVAAVQVSDREEAERGLGRLAEHHPDEELRFAFPDGEDYVLLAEDQAVVDAAAREGDHLSDDRTFRAAVDALDGDQVALGWVDLAGVWAAVPEQERAGGLGPDVDLGGSVVVGAHVEDDAVELTGTSVGLSLGDAERVRALLDTPIGRASPVGLVGDLPRDSVFAFGVTGLGDGLAELYDSFGEEIGDQVEDVVADLGLRLPDDLRAVLGTELAVGSAGDLVAQEGRIEALARTPEPARAVELLDQARDALGEEGVALVAEEVDGGYRVGYETPGAPAASGGRLGDDELFRRTVPDAARAGTTCYVVLDDLLESYLGLALDEGHADDLEPLRAVGLTSTLEDDGDVGFRLRLAVD